MKRQAKVISGYHAVKEALCSGVPLHAIYIDKDKKGHRAEIIKRAARELNVKVVEVPKKKLDELTEGAHQGFVALVSEIRFLNLRELLEKIPPNEPPLLVMLDGITDVGNAGSILRTMDAVGAHGLIIQQRHSPYFGEGLAKTSAGAVWYVPVARVKNLNRTIEELKEMGFWVVATVASGGQSVFKFDGNIPMVLILGSEDEGVRKSILEKADFKITIPQRGKVDSLNVSVAAGIILYHIARSRGWL